VPINSMGGCRNDGHAALCPSYLFGLSLGLRDSSRVRPFILVIWWLVPELLSKKCNYPTLHTATASVMPPDSHAAHGNQEKFPEKTGSSTVSLNSPAQKDKARSNERALSEIQRCQTGNVLERHPEFQGQGMIGEIFTRLKVIAGHKFHPVYRLHCQTKTATEQQGGWINAVGDKRPSPTHKG